MHSLYKKVLRDGKFHDFIRLGNDRQRSCRHIICTFAMFLRWLTCCHTLLRKTLSLKPAQRWDASHCLVFRALPLFFFFFFSPLRLNEMFHMRRAAPPMLPYLSGTRYTGIIIEQQTPAGLDIYTGKTSPNAPHPRPYSEYS